MLKIIKKNVYLFTLLIIVFIASALRFYKLGEVPHGMTWDEAAIGYNGFAIWETRRDEWLKFLPVSFQSFGDYKAPLAIYLNGFFTKIFGLNLWAVRLPFAIGGVLGVIGFIKVLETIIFSIDKSLKKSAVLNKEILVLVGAVLLAVSPWHHHFSRAGFESGLALTFLIWSIWFLLSFLKGKSNFWIKLFKMVMASGLAVASMYAYHSAKLVVPLIGLLFFAMFFKKFKQEAKLTMLATLATVLMLSPMVMDTFLGPGGQRLEQTSVVGSQVSLLTKFRVISLNLFEHFDPLFLVMGETTNLRHGDGTWGVLFPTTFVLVLLAIFFFGKDWFVKSKKSVEQKRWFLFSLGWLLIGLFPASLGVDDVPHSNRALFALPAFIILALLGLQAVITWIESSNLNKQVKGSHGEKNIVAKLFLGGFLLVHMLVSLAYLNRYYTAFAAESTADFQDGYLEMFDFVKPFEKGEDGAKEVTKIVVTSDYGQPYIYALFGRKTNPIWYQGGSLVKYEFKDVDLGDLHRENSVVVASGEDDMSTNEPDHVIYGSDGLARFKIFITD